MDQIKALIVDDEELCRKGIRLLLDADDCFETVGECANGAEAIRDIRDKRPDVVFLDIQMPEIDGFDVISSFGAEELPLIVFVTAYDQYAIRAFEVHAIDYILKPFTRKRFGQALENIKSKATDRDASGFGKSMMELLRQVQSRKAHMMPEAPAGATEYLDRILVGERGAHKVVQVRDIEWVEGADYYVNLHCADRSYLYRERLKNLEARLPPASFARVHKSAIVNLDHMDKIIADYKNRNFAVMTSGAKVRISKARKKELFSVCQSRFGLKSEP